MIGDWGLKLLVQGYGFEEWGLGIRALGLDNGI